GDETLVRDIPRAAGISKEATNVALTALTKSGHGVVDGRSAATRTLRLTSSGEATRIAAFAIHAGIETAWAERVGADELARFRSTLDAVLAHPDLVIGLRPHPDGWRARSPYLAHTHALLHDPRGTLPHYPMVLHRGGWPDGS